MVVTSPKSFVVLVLLWFTQQSANTIDAFHTVSRTILQLHRTVSPPSTSSTLLKAKLSSYESLLEFNAQFKQGLKYVLVPQAPRSGTLPANYYDGTVPETLDAPLANSAMDYTSVGNSVPTASATTATTRIIDDMSMAIRNIEVPKMNAGMPQINTVELPSMNMELPQINVELPNIVLPTLSSTTDTLNAMGRDVDQLLQSTAKTVVINSDKLDAMGRDVDRVLQAARSVVSSSVEIAANMPILEVAAKANTQIVNAAAVANTKIVDPVVDRTMEQIKYAITHPPDFTDYTIAGAPPGQGLATPLINAIADGLRTARETPPLYFADPLPDDYRTIAYGFQAKVTAIETAQKIQSSIYDTAQQIAANNAVVKEEIKKVMASELQQLQARNAIIAEKVAAQSQLNLEYLHSSQDAFANRILDNAQSLQNQFHLYEWTANLERTILDNLQSNNVYKSDQMSKIIASLKLEEYGGWYAGTILGVLLIQLARNDKEAAIQKATAKITMETQQQIEQSNIEKQRLEGMVVELTEAVSLLTDELRLLKSQRIQTDTVLASVEKDVKNVINDQLTASITENVSLRKELESTKVELQSVLDANKLLSSQTVTPIQPHPPLSPPPVAQVVSDPEVVKNAFFATTTVPPTSSSETVAPAPKKVPPAASSPASASTKASSPTSASTDTNDWRNLPFSSIKRKPLTEIMAYLQAKGLDVVGEDGKPLPKSKLLEAIFSM